MSTGSRLGTVTRLSRRVSSICNVSALGGRCSVVDSTRCVLYDCARWTSDMSMCILEEFPTCSITISSVEASVSGFAVIFVLHERSRRPHTTFFVLLLLATFSVVSIYVFRTVSDTLPLFPQGVYKWALLLRNFSVEERLLDVLQ